MNIIIVCNSRIKKYLDSLVYEISSKMMGGDGITGTIRTTPENYWIATINEYGRIDFDSWEKADKAVEIMEHKSSIEHLWKKGLIKTK